MTDIGFTGTRKGMSDSQKLALTTTLRLICGGKGDNTFHHGGEEHADLEAAEIAENLGMVEMEHLPRQNGLATAFLARNRVIVESSELLIAAPDSLTERQRSGTWYTVRYARKYGIPIIILDR